MLSHAGTRNTKHIFYGFRNSPYLLRQQRSVFRVVLSLPQVLLHFSFAHLMFYTCKVFRVVLSLPQVDFAKTPLTLPSCSCCLSLSLTQDTLSTSPILSLDSLSSFSLSLIE